MADYTMENIKNIMDGLTSKGQKTDFLKTLSTEQKKAYKSYKSNERNKRVRADPEKKAIYNEEQKKIMRQNRAEDPVKYREMNIIHNRTYRDKLKALNTISNAIKNKKAKKELGDLRDAKATKDLISNLVNDAITQATTKTTIKGRPKGSKNKEVDVKVYNARSRGK